MTIDVPLLWQQLAEDLAAATDWRRVVVLGATDMGKSTLCRFLGHFFKVPPPAAEAAHPVTRWRRMPPASIGPYQHHRADHLG